MSAVLKEDDIIHFTFRKDNILQKGYVIKDDLKWSLIHNDVSVVVHNYRWSMMTSVNDLKTSLSVQKFINEEFPQYLI